MPHRRTFRSFEDAFTAPPAPAPTAPTRVAANDNRPAASTAVRYRGSLPALRWLFDKDPELGRAVAIALREAKAQTTLPTAVADQRHEIRPTTGELLRAAGDENVQYLPDEWAVLGELRFHRGELKEWGTTKKGRTLRPTERTISAGGATPPRSPGLYIRTKTTTPSPMAAEHLHRPMSGAPVLASMYDPLPATEHNRRILEQAYARSPAVPVNRCPTVVAKGAVFLGGVSSVTGNSSQPGAAQWEAPRKHKGEVGQVLEEVAARGTLRSIGERLGYVGEYCDRAGKRALLEAAHVLLAANDNNKKKVAA